MSTVSKGNYYKNRTKRWLEGLGYEVGNIEQSYRVFSRGGVVFRKEDLWGADLVAKTEDQMVFIQVKSRSDQIAEGIKQLLRTPWPDFIELWVLYWPKGRRLVNGPEITEVKKT